MLDAISLAIFSKFVDIPTKKLSTLLFKTYSAIHSPLKHSNLKDLKLKFETQIFHNYKYLSISL